MKRQELLDYLDKNMLDRLYGFCYARTRSSYEAEELCSDIVFALVKAAERDGEIENVDAFIRRVVRNVYADYSDKRSQKTAYDYQGNPEIVLMNCAEETDEENRDSEQLKAIYRGIAFLSKAYREVMISFYLESKTIAEIAAAQGVSENAVKQRLFSARQTIKSEVNEMDTIKNKPISLNKIEYVIWGNGDPLWGDPREGFERQFSKHIVWACHDKAKTAKEISEMLNVPMLYVEEELEILTRGKNGKYGLLRKTDNGRYALNFMLLDKEQIEELHNIYISRTDMISKKIVDYVEKNKEKYLAFPYLNHKVDLNLILWQQVYELADALIWAVDSKINEYFADVKPNEREFTVFGYVDNGIYYGVGWDGIRGDNICGYSYVDVQNIKNDYINSHFHCGNDLATDKSLQIAIRAIYGLDVSKLNESEKEAAANAIEQGYVYREGDNLYTKILVSDRKDVFELSRGINPEFASEADEIAEEISKFIKKNVPEFFLSEYRSVNALASLPVRNIADEALIEKGLITPPESRVSAEGCWMTVTK